MRSPQVTLSGRSVPRISSSSLLRLRLPPASCTRQEGCTVNTPSALRSLVSPPCSEALLPDTAAHSASEHRYKVLPVSSSRSHSSSASGANSSTRSSLLSISGSELHLSPPKLSNTGLPYRSASDTRIYASGSSETFVLPKRRLSDSAAPFGLRPLVNDSSARGRTAPQSSNSASPSLPVPQLGIESAMLLMSALPPAMPHSSTFYASASDSNTCSGVTLRTGEDRSSLKSGGSPTAFQTCGVPFNGNFSAVEVPSCSDCTRGHRPAPRCRIPPLPPPAPHFILSPYGDSRPTTPSGPQRSVINSFHHAHTHAFASPPPPPSTKQPATSCESTTSCAFPFTCRTVASSKGCSGNPARCLTPRVSQNTSEPTDSGSEQSSASSGGSSKGLSPKQGVKLPTPLPKHSSEQQHSDGGFSCSPSSKATAKNPLPFRCGPHAGRPSRGFPSQTSLRGYDRRAVDAVLSNITAFDNELKNSAQNVMRFMDRLQVQQQQQQEAACSRESSSPACSVKSANALGRMCFYPLVKRETIQQLKQALKQRNWPEYVLQEMLSHSVEVLERLEMPVMRRDVSRFRLEAAGQLKPHPLKEYCGGEDYYFISEEAGAIGVADGVSEWRSFGVNPRLFAEQLMERCKEAANIPAKNGCSGHHNRAQNILRDGFSKVSVYGGSTATVACLDEAGSSLEVSNLGDSTLIVLRRNRLSGSMHCVFRTVELQHTFNMPYQLIRLPQLNDVHLLKEQGLPELAKVTLRIRLGGSRPLDTPEDATMYRVPLVEGDLLLVGTDGLFDNLYEDEICELATLAVSPLEATAAGNRELSTSPKLLADVLAEVAAHRSKDRNAIIPFLLNAQKAGLIKNPADRAGGKLDDIAVVISWVVSGNSTPSAAPRLARSSSSEATFQNLSSSWAAGWRAHPRSSRGIDEGDNQKRSGADGSDRKGAPVGSLSVGINEYQNTHYLQTEAGSETTTSKASSWKDSLATPYAEHRDALWGASPGRSAGSAQPCLQGNMFNGCESYNNAASPRLASFHTDAAGSSGERFSDWRRGVDASQTDSSGEQQKAGCEHTCDREVAGTSPYSKTKDLFGNSAVSETVAVSYNMIAERPGASPSTEEQR